MRIVAPAVAATIAAGISIYYVARVQQDKSEPVIKADKVSLKTDPVTTKRSGDSLARNRLSQQTQDGEMQVRQSQINQQLTSMEARVGALEAMPKSATDSPEEGDTDQRKKGKISESDLGQWLGDKLDAEEPDTNWTTRVVTFVEQNGVQMPGVLLESAACGHRFCRATFFREDGSVPEVRSLFGGVPDTRGGFTLVGEDGRVELYLIRHGESIDELRGEALAAGEQ